VVCPAMHSEMWTNPATQSNVAALIDRGIVVMNPASGRLTGDDSGPGRLPEVEEILEFVTNRLLLSGKKVLVTAGGTREPIDSVRFLGNSSSGKQGIEVAKAARDAGADVTLIAANVSVPLPKGVKVENVSTVAEMSAAMKPGFDVLVMAAAVSDFHVANRTDGKLPSKVIPNLVLGENPDLVARYSSDNPDTLVCGFALEDAQGPELSFRAKQKLGRKGLNMIVANSLSALSSDSNEVLVVDATGEQAFSGSKREIAQALIRLIAAKLP
ncbi:MAG: bifunctional phosphopantothenoylcysteine decarboxylase/phosphopantothenate--cysteine ligase CoaBC, partial [Actinomycetota bacterium]